MAKSNFVGFQEQIEIPDGYQLIVVEDLIESSLSRDRIFEAISFPEKVSQWLYQVEKLDLRAGGKIEFSRDSGEKVSATCTGATLGSELTLISDDFGNMKAEVVKRSNGFALQITFAILTNDPETKRAFAESSIKKLRALI